VGTRSFTVPSPLATGAASWLTLHFLKVIWIYEGFVQIALEISVVFGPPLAFFSRVHGSEGNFGFSISLHKCFILVSEAPFWDSVPVLFGLQ